MKCAQVLPLFYATLFWLFATIATGDGGAVVFSGEQGPLRITVFTEPVPPRVGPIDLSLLVQDKESLEVIEAYDAQVSLTHQDDSTLEAIKMPLDRAAETNRLFQAALLTIPVAGTWQVVLEIEPANGDPVDGGMRNYRFTFPLTIAKSLPRVWDMLLWILLPVVPLLIFLAGKLRRVVKEQQE